jgi:hypothetical protein
MPCQSFFASNSASRWRSARSSFHRLVSSRRIAAMSRDFLSGVCTSATVKAMDMVRPSLWRAGTRSTSVPYWVSLPDTYVDR